MGKHKTDADCFIGEVAIVNTEQQLMAGILGELAIIADALEASIPVPLEPIVFADPVRDAIEVGYCQTCRFHELVKPGFETAPCHVHGSFAISGKGDHFFLTADDFGCVHYERGKAWES